MHGLREFIVLFYLLNRGLLANVACTIHFKGLNLLFNCCRLSLLFINASWRAIRTQEYPSKFLKTVTVLNFKLLYDHVAIIQVLPATKSTNWTLYL